MNTLILSPVLTTIIIVTSCAVFVLPHSAPSAVVYFQPPKTTARIYNANTKDWDVIYKFINKLGSQFSKSSNVKRSQQESQPTIGTFGSLLYGLSMAAGLALGVTISESPVLNAVINGLDYRFMTRRSQLEQIPRPLTPAVPSVAPKLIDPQIHRYVAPSKDGKDHYHHVVHYHIPYPLSVGALGSARQNYPQISWYGSGMAGTSPNDAAAATKTNSILSGYLGPMYKAPDVEKSVHDMQTSIEDIRRNDRHDFRVFSEAEYFKNFKQRSRPKYHNHKPMEKSASPSKSSATTSLEDMLFTDSDIPNLLGEHPNHSTSSSSFEQSVSSSNTSSIIL